MFDFEIDTSRLVKCPIDVANIPDGWIEMPRGKYKPTEKVFVATWFPAEAVRERGLPGAAVCGIVEAPALKITTDNFIQNKHFINTLHEFNRNYPDPEAVQTARSFNDRGVAIIDQRSADVDAAIPNEDILGYYSIEDGKLALYHENPNYRLVTTSGIFKLTPWLRRLLVDIILNETQPPDGNIRNH